MTEELQHKVERSIKLIKLAAGDDVIEVAYSGGKDSDVILELTKMAGVKYRAIYKNTTIDPSGTIKHAKDMGAEILMPKDGMTFFKLVEKRGYPNRIHRFCCEVLKEYKILDKVVIGIRRAESIKRSRMYKEPTRCRVYSKKEKAEHIMPILDWNNKDVLEFINERNIQLAPVYYNNGVIDIERRLGCMCCPLKNIKGRIQEFREHPNMIKAYVRAGHIFMKTHPDGKIANTYKDCYEYFCRSLFYDSQKKYEATKQGLFADEVDYKAFLESYFNIKFNTNIPCTH